MKNNLTNLDLILVRNVFKSQFDKDPNKIKNIKLIADSEEKVEYEVICNMIKNEKLIYESDDLKISYISEQNQNNKELKC